MKRRIAGWLAAAITLGLVMTGCSNDQVHKETGRYNMQSHQDGSLRALSQGKGLNSRFLKQMRLSFARQHIPLTHERYSEDGRGNTSYQYLIDSQPSQLITIHIFSSEHELLNRVSYWYGTSQVSETSTTRTEVYNKNNVSFVYTSIVENKGKYSQQVKGLIAGFSRPDFK